MKQIIMKLVLAITLVLAPTMALGGTVYAASSGCGTPSSSKTQVLNGIGETGGNCDSSGVATAISAAVNILSIVVGIAAVLMVILSGFKYITSGGEAGKVSNAKNSLIYALIGLIVAALAQIMVHFVINQSTAAACPPGSQEVTCQTAPKH